MAPSEIPVTDHVEWKQWKSSTEWIYLTLHVYSKLQTEITWGRREIEQLANVQCRRPALEKVYFLEIFLAKTFFWIYFLRNIVFRHIFGKNILFRNIFGENIFSEIFLVKIFLVTKVFPLITKVFPLITKVLPLVTKIFPLNTMVSSSNLLPPLLWNDNQQNHLKQWPTELITNRVSQNIL